MADPQVPAGTPDEVRERVLHGPERVPVTDPTLGIPVTVTEEGEPLHRLVVLGDSLAHGFQSGSVFHTDLSFPAIIAYELGCLDRYRYPRYAGFGGLPLNLELLVRRLEASYGADMDPWEEALALFSVRSFMDRVEDYWERGPGTAVPALTGYLHDLAVYGWDLRDVLDRTARTCRDDIGRPHDDLVKQVVENNGDRAALRVYPSSAEDADLTLLDAARALGEEGADRTGSGIETLVVLLGANNVLPCVTRLAVRWSGADFRDLKRKSAYTVWTPQHFEAELAELVTAVGRVGARHVIWGTVPHVTIAPIARGVGRKMAPGSRYFPYYTRPWVDDAAFDAAQDPHLTGDEARAVDAAVDCYNDAIEAAVHRARSGDAGPPRDWRLLDLAGLLDRLAARRYIDDPQARPGWWTPYPLPPALAALRPVPDSRFLTGDGAGGRATGGLFSLDGVHPTTVAYGVLAQEVVTVMSDAGVVFRHADGRERQRPVAVDFNRLLRRDTLVERPPQNITAGLRLLGWADETVDWVRRALDFH